MTSTLTTRIPIVTAINAGRGIPDDLADWEITGFRDIRVVAPSDPAARFMAVPVEGDSLAAVGILDGDILICRLTTRYQSGRIGIWQTPHGRTAKFAFIDYDQTVVLHNDSDWRQTWPAEEVRLIALVDRVERDYI